MQAPQCGCEPLPCCQSNLGKCCKSPGSYKSHRQADAMGASAQEQPQGDRAHRDPWLLWPGLQRKGAGDLPTTRKHLLTLLALWQSSVQGTNLLHPEITRCCRDLLCTWRLGSSSPRCCTLRAPLQQLKPTTSVGVTEGPAHHGSSFGPADLADQAPRGPPAR